MADDGPLQLSLFDQQDLAEIESPDFPGERLIDRLVSGVSLPTGSLRYER